MDLSDSPPKLAAQEVPATALDSSQEPRWAEREPVWAGAEGGTHSHEFKFLEVCKTMDGVNVVFIPRINLADLSPILGHTPRGAWDLQRAMIVAPQIRPKFMWFEWLDLRGFCGFPPGFFLELSLGFP